MMHTRVISNSAATGGWNCRRLDAMIGRKQACTHAAAQVHEAYGLRRQQCGRVAPARVTPLAPLARLNDKSVEMLRPGPSWNYKPAGAPWRSAGANVCRGRNPRRLCLPTNDFNNMHRFKGLLLDGPICTNGGLRSTVCTWASVGGSGPGMG